MLLWGSVWETSERSLGTCWLPPLGGEGQVPGAEAHRGLQTCSEVRRRGTVLPWTGYEGDRDSFHCS